MTLLQAADNVPADSYAVWGELIIASKFGLFVTAVLFVFAMLLWRDPVRDYPILQFVFLAVATIVFGFSVWPYLPLVEDAALVLIISFALVFAAMSLLYAYSRWQLDESDVIPDPITHE